MGALSGVYGDDQTLLQRLLGLMGGESGEEMSKKLNYVPLDLTTVRSKWEFFKVNEVRSYVESDVKKYCVDHNILPLDLISAGVEILVNKALGLRENPNMWNSLTEPRFTMFFPIHRGGEVVAAWLRLINWGGGSGEKKLPPWMALGFRANGGLLYTGALPSGLEPGANGNFPRSPLVLVESAVDALRVTRLGWKSVGVGGTYIPKKMRKELGMLPFRNYVVLLDSDATDLALDLHGKLEGLAKSRGGQVVLAECPAKAGREVTDPSSLTDLELRGVLMPTLQHFRTVPSRRATEAPEGAEALDGEGDSLEAEIVDSSGTLAPQEGYSMEGP